MASSLAKGMVMRSIKLPIIIVDKRGDDISIHTSIEDAQLDLEAIDVLNKEYRAYDSEGRILALDVVRDKTALLFGLFKTTVDRVNIQVAEEEPQHADELRMALLRFLGRLGVVDISPTSNRMDQLIEAAMELSAKEKS